MDETSGVGALSALPILSPVVPFIQFAFVRNLQGPQSPCTNCKRVMASVLRIDSITSLPAEFITAIEIVSL